MPTNMGMTVGISTTPQNADLDDHATLGFPGLTYTDIANIGNVGDHGYNTNMVSYPTMGRPITSKAKGATDGGDYTIECAQPEGGLTDPGQIAADAAGDPLNSDSYAFKVEWPDGQIHYLRGPVSGPNFPGGGNEDFRRAVYTVGVNQILRIPAP